MAIDPYPFTIEFSTAIARQLLADPVLLPRLAAHLKPERFSDENVQRLVAAALSYYKKYGLVPTRVAVLQEIRQGVDDGKVTWEKLQACTEVLELADSQPAPDSNHVLDKIFAAERRSSLWSALDDGFKNWKNGNFDEIARSVDRADRIGRVDLSMGTDFRTSVAARTDQRLHGKTPPRWGTGIVHLDDVIAGGLGNGELGCVLGAPKFGKSMYLDFVSLSCMEYAGTVVFISLEMGETAIVDRHDAAISRIPINNLRQRAVQVRERVDTWLAETGGGLVVKQFTPRTTTTRSIRGYLQQLRAERSIVPTMLVVDYGDLLGADSSSFEARHEELGVVYTELRALAVDLNIPVWTASQANRESLTKKTVSAVDIAESFKKVAIADVIIAICRTEEERMNRQIRFFVSQCRYATDGIEVGPMPSAYELGRIVADGEWSTRK